MYSVFYDYNRAETRTQQTVKHLFLSLKSFMTTHSSRANKCTLHERYDKETYHPKEKIYCIKIKIFALIINLRKIKYLEMDRIWVLIASVPDLCILFTFKIQKGVSVSNA